MLIITIYKISDTSGCYLIVKSHEDYQGSQREQLRTFVAELLSLAISARMWFDSRGVTLLSNSQGCEYSDFAHILKLRHNGTVIQSSQCMQYLTAHALRAIKSSTFSTGFRGISPLDSSFIFLR